MNESQSRAGRIIVALDTDSKQEALQIVKQLPQVEIFKVGLKLFTLEGPLLLKDIHNLGKKIFLDLKMHDIPNTVAQSVRAAIRYGVSMLTLHTSGGKEMMARAVEEGKEEAAREKCPPPLFLAVTLLTSLKKKELRDIGMNPSIPDQVLRLSHLAQTAGMDGVVCSPQEIELIKNKYGKNLKIVVPGIRPQWAANHDQKRIMTPSQAFQKKADFLVIGRPIIQASSPSNAFQLIVEESYNSPNSSDCGDSPKDHPHHNHNH
ncbi:orotidine-5'-phosphate decarboxylase [bacterium]|nr:orotidine-5'-phosphate decarboxylase [bacterium]